MFTSTLVLVLSILSAVPRLEFFRGMGGELTVKLLNGKITQAYGINAAAISLGRQIVVVGGGTGYNTGNPKERPVAELVVWDVKTRKKVVALEGHTRPVWSVAFSPDGNTVVSGSADKTARLWDATTGKELAVLKDSPNGLYSVAFSPDGKTVAGAVWVNFDGREPPDWTAPGAVLLWDVATRKVRAKLEVSTGAISRLVFSPDGRILAGSTGKYDKQTKGSVSGEVWFWDVVTGRHLRTLKANDSYLTSFAFSPNGKTLATGGDTWENHPKGDGRGKVRLWDVATLKPLTVAEVHESSISDLAFSPDGKILVAVSGPIAVPLGSPFPNSGAFGTVSDIILLEGATLKTVARLPRQDGNSLGCSFWNDQNFVTLLDNQVLFWELMKKP